MAILLPPSTDITSSSTTQGGAKVYHAAIRAFLAALLGTDAEDKPAARTALGLDVGTDVMAHVAPGPAGNVLTSKDGEWKSAPSQSAGAATLAETQAGVVTDKFVSPATFAGSSLGIGQTWQDITASRVSGTTYYNTTGKPILIAPAILESAGSSSAYARVTINGVSAGYISTFGGGNISSGQFVVGPGASYSLTLVQSCTLNSWAELR